MFTQDSKWHLAADLEDKPDEKWPAWNVEKKKDDSGEFIE
jgi:hypothetical protein